MDKACALSFSDSRKSTDKNTSLWAQVPAGWKFKFFVLCLFHVLVLLCFFTNNLHVSLPGSLSSVHSQFFLVPLPPAMLLICRRPFLLLLRPPLIIPPLPLFPLVMGRRLVFFALSL